MNKKWELSKPDEKIVERLQKEYNLTELLANCLVSRGITSSEQLRVFLEPTRDDFHDPFEMPDMKKAIDRIIKAIDTNEKVIIYGDYDVDGITSTMVLKRFLGEHGLDVDYKIPNRLNEGYGLNKEAVKKIADDGYSLIITVDCGISGLDEVEYANSLGLEVIITDHHETKDTIPNCVAVIDCKRKDSKYPFKSLAGCGVVLKLIQAISQEKGYKPESYLKYLDIVCVGTISDIVPLVDENRLIAKLGLMLIKQTRNPGLSFLINSTGFKEINSTAISFGLAPRINACGRMGFEEEAIKLFLTDNIEEAKNITIKLNDFNKQRQEIEKTIFEDAIKQIEENKMENDPIIVVAGEGWHHGVIGIVSSKITEVYYKPSILVCFDGEIAKGSGRSVPGFDLHNALCESDEFLLKYGGHEMAIGLTLERKNFEKFKEKIKEIASKANLEEFVPILKIDKELEAKDISEENIRDLEKLEPFGESNKTPIFLYRNLKIDSIRSLSEGKHLKLTLKDDINYIILTAIGFNMGNLANEYRLFDKVDVVGTLEINEFNGRRDIQINLKDIRKSI